MARRGARLTRYLVLSQSVPAGAVVEGPDLQGVELSSPVGVSAIPVTDASQVIGRRVSETVVAGSLLVVGDFLGGASPSTGDALVGTSLQPNQVPSSLQPGDDVLVVLSSTSGSSTGSSTTPAAPGAAAVIGSTPVVLGRGTVFALTGGGSAASGTASESTGVESVTISVPSGSASVIAAASAASDVSLVEVPPGTPGLRGATR
ncbi:MAG: SAF domain-containing protein [Acidimicrobiales bacterium]